MISESMKSSIIGTLKESAEDSIYYCGSVDCFDSYEDLTEDLYRWFKSEGLTIDYVKPVKEYNRVEFKVNWEVPDFKDGTLRHELIRISRCNLVYMFNKVING